MFNKDQEIEIMKGKSMGLDASAYSDPKLSVDQMMEIRFGLLSGLDTSAYADPDIPADKMREIRIDLETEKILKEA